MLAILVKDPFDREGWIFESKWDGCRAIAETGKKEILLYSRNWKSFDTRYPDIVDSLKRLKRRAVLDGEIVALDSKGKSSFQLLQNYPRTKKGNLAYYVFDLLSLDGEDLRDLPLLERKKRLKRILHGISKVRFSDHVERKGISFFKAMQKRGFEGMIAKDAQSPYREGVRSDEWLKVKTHLRQEAIICGFTAPRRSRQYFGSLILCTHEKGNLRYVGLVGTGFTVASLKALHEKLAPLVVSESPIKDIPKFLSGSTWVKPVLVGEIRFQEWTTDRIMRQPSFQGLREDKAAREVTRETSKVTAKVLKRKSSS